MSAIERRMMRIVLSSETPIACVCRMRKDMLEFPKPKPLAPSVCERKTGNTG
jgi:hypothetical protein